MNKSLKFSQKHPFLFGLGLIFLAMVLITGAMAFFNSSFWQEKFPWFQTPKIGVVYIQGVIENSLPITRWINKLTKDKSIKGILVRIDSPGGLVGPSQEIYASLCEAAKHKPVVASMGAMATSGGYYVALGANKIIANPGTLTASIGVKASLANFKGLLDKIGIEEQTIASGKLKNAGTPFRPLTPEEKKYFKEIIQNLYSQFVRTVCKQRHLPLKKVQPIADGRAITGEQALKLGLIDELGNFEHALLVLQHMLNLKKTPRLVEGPPKENSLLNKILGLTNLNNLSKLTKSQFGPTWIFSYE
ncbi:MAG: signal peptide peptidase SppA [Desulfonauticus sp.]|nr:signal peptide peptidase SppA [Desulfonauticus sp.]